MSQPPLPSQCREYTIGATLTSFLSFVTSMSKLTPSEDSNITDILFHDAIPPKIPSVQIEME